MNITFFEAASLQTQDVEDHVSLSLRLLLGTLSLETVLMDRLDALCHSELDHTHLQGEGAQESDNITA